MNVMTTLVVLVVTIKVDVLLRHSLDATTQEVLHGRATIQIVIHYHAHLVVVVYRVVEVVLI
jgi:hypothetical protein